jgi:protein phosphatase
MKTQGFGLTDVGAVREHNEDSFAVDNESGLYVVCDGVGGRSAGEVASQMAVDIIKGYMNKTRESDEAFIGEYDKGLSRITNHLGSAIRMANKVVHEASNSKPNLRGMGSTVVAAFVDEGTVSLAHAGDSRAYLIREGTIKQLTDDHSLVNEQLRKGLITKEQARKSEVKNVITRALGPDHDIEADLAEHKLEAGDRLVLCSDGLSNMVPDEDILSIIDSAERIDRACMDLIKLANKNGGDDNITAVIIAAEKSGILDFFKKR